MGQNSTQGDVLTVALRAAMVSLVSLRTVPELPTGPGAGCIPGCC